MSTAVPQSRKDDASNIEALELTERDWKFNRKMYFEVGEKGRWIDKRPWTDQQWKDYANDPNLRTFAGYHGEALVGYYELNRKANSGVEIAFGLLPNFIGADLAARF